MYILILFSSFSTPTLLLTCYLLLHVVTFVFFSPHVSNSTECKNYRAVCVCGENEAFDIHKRAVLMRKKLSLLFHLAGVLAHYF